jgi:hypothetical protein
MDHKDTGAGRAQAPQDAPQTPLRRVYALQLSDNERDELRRAIREARERTPATGVSPADWLRKDALDHAARELEAQHAQSLKQVMAQDDATRARRLRGVGERARAEGSALESNPYNPVQFADAHRYWREGWLAEDEAERT